jgi:hypothetical protein
MRLLKLARRAKGERKRRDNLLLPAMIKESLEVDSADDVCTMSATVAVKLAAISATR